MSGVLGFRKKDAEEYGRTEKTSLLDVYRRIYKVPKAKCERAVFVSDLEKAIAEEYEKKLKWFTSLNFAKANAFQRESYFKVQGKLQALEWMRKELKRFSAGFERVSGKASKSALGVRKK